jgi:hypothetical protein
MQPEQFKIRTMKHFNHIVQAFLIMLLVVARFSINKHDMLQANNPVLSAGIFSHFQTFRGKAFSVTHFNILNGQSHHR